MPQRAISLPFSFDSSGGLSYTTDEVKIMQDRIAIVVLTRLQERVMRPSFGSGVQSNVFESADTAILLSQEDIQAAFSEWLPYLTLVRADGYVDAEQKLNIEIVFKYGNANENTVLLKTAILNRAGDTILEVTNG